MGIEYTDEDQTDLELLSLDDISPYDMALSGDWDEERTLSILANLPAYRITQKEVG